MPADHVIPVAFPLPVSVFKCIAPGSDLSTSTFEPALPVVNSWYNSTWSDLTCNDAVVPDLPSENI